MNLEEIEHERQMKVISIFGWLCPILYPPWYFLFQWLTGPGSDFLWPRLFISFLGPLVAYVSKVKSLSYTARRTIYLSIPTFIISHYAFLLGHNNWGFDYRYGYEITSIIMVATSVTLNQFLFLAGYSLVAPMITQYFTPFDIQQFVMFTAGNVALFIVFGVNIVSNIKNRTEIINITKKANLNSKMAALGAMAAGMAHEINNPLAIIKGKVQKLKKYTSNLNNPQFGEALVELEKIDSTTNRIAKIIKGLRVFSRQDDDDPMKQILLKDWIENSMGICQERIRNNHIELKVAPIPDLFIRGHEAQLDQVLINLISNSLDAIKDSKKKEISVDFNVMDDNLMVLVKDSGPGIPVEIREKIMEPFFTTKGPGIGTGLGLSISKGIMEQHNGKLVFNSESKETCFVITIPISKEHSIYIQ